MYTFICVLITFVVAVAFDTYLRKHGHYYDSLIGVIEIVSMAFMIIFIFRVVYVIQTEDKHYAEDQETYTYLQSLGEEDKKNPYVQKKIQEWNKYISNSKRASDSSWTDIFYYQYYDEFDLIN